MIGDKDIRLSRLEVRSPLYGHREKEETGDDPCPALPWIIAPEMPVAKHTPEGDNEGSQNGDHDQEGKGHQQLIEVI